MAGLAAVSYTHLSGSGVASSADATLYSSSGGSSSGVKFATDTNTPGSITAMRNAEYFRMRISDATVSYTHLDVYKRQVLRREAMAHQQCFEIQDQVVAHR